MCPHCRAFITTSDKVCPYCNLETGPRAIELRDPGNLLGLIPHARFTTVVILILNTALFAATSLYSNKTGIPNYQTLQIFGAKLPFALMQGELWRLVTAGFLHGGILHILMNSWVLFDLGAEVESVFGTSRFIVYYFVSTVTGFLTSAFFSPSLSIGASAGIFGLIGAMIAFGITDKSTMASYSKARYVRWAIYGLLMGFIGIFGTDNAAHIGGIAGGFVIAFLLRTPLARRSWKEPLVTGLAAVCLILTAYSFFEMFLSVTAS